MIDAKNITVEQVYGDALLKAIPEIAELRISIFKEYPYLYEGTYEYEQNYLRSYFKSKRACVLVAKYFNDIIGASTGIPMSDAGHEFQKPFVDAKYDINKIYYFGESVLLKQYRGFGVGNKFFDEREKVARSYGQYNLTCFCAVDRTQDKVLPPADYQPLDSFWKKRGYQKSDSLICYYEWKDIHEAKPTLKPMNYWIKKWA